MTENALPNQCPLECQKLIAYAVLGYLDVLRRGFGGDAYINLIFQPVRTSARLKILKADERLVEALYQLDELETLRDLQDDRQFEASLNDIVGPIVDFLRQERQAKYSSIPAVDRLLQ